MPWQDLRVETSCVDSCCKNHDMCCGWQNRRICNRNMIMCLYTCIGAFKNDCFNGLVTVKPEYVGAPFLANVDGCCGGSCDDDYLPPEVPCYSPPCTNPPYTPNPRG